jgi:ATP-dependent DNA ligase
MEAPSVGEIPTANGWQYEPKWDRSLSVFRDHNNVCLQSKNGQPLARYFPNVVNNVASCHSNGSFLRANW